jgi:hypothetical protein
MNALCAGQEGRDRKRIAIGQGWLQWRRFNDLTLRQRNGRELDLWSIWEAITADDVDGYRLAGLAPFSLKSERRTMQLSLGQFGTPNTIPKSLAAEG